MSTMGERIRISREARGLLQSELARRIGVKSGGVISNWEKNVSKPDAEKLVRLCQALEISASYLLDYYGEKDAQALSPEALRFARQYEALDDHGRAALDAILTVEQWRMEETARPRIMEAPPEKRKIKHYLVAPAAGYAQPIEGADYEMIPLPEGAPRDADFCVNVSGDSMEPFIRDGEMVYVKRDAPLSLFDVGVFYLNGDVYIKQFCIDQDGTVYLLSANPKRESANKTVRADSGATFVCYGKVLLPKRPPQPHYL